MTITTDPVEQLEQSADPRDRAVLELATLLSPAPVIEPELLRAVRVRIVPALDVGAEADVWFSALVADRGPSGITLRWCVVPVLLDRLRKRIEDAEDDVDDPIHTLGDVLEEVHQCAPPLRRVQEHVTWLAIARGEAAQTEIDDLLLPVTKTLRDDARRSDVAQWAHRNLRWLPETVQETGSAWELGLAASLETGEDAGLRGEVPDELMDRDVADLMETGDLVTLPILRRNGRVELGDVADVGFGIRVPPTNPRVVRLSWPDYDEGRSVAVAPDRVVKVEDRSGPLRVRTLQGLVYEIGEHQQPRVTQPATETHFRIEMLPADHGESLWIEYGEPEAPHRILIDGGTKRTGRHLVQRVEALPADQRRFDLIVLTRINSNRSDGLIKLLTSELELHIGDFWFNAFKHLPAESTEEALGPARGTSLSAILDQRQIPWNLAFDGRAVQAGEDSLRTVELPGGMRVTVLGPDEESLRRLRSYWARESVQRGKSGAKTAKTGEPPVEKSPLKDDVPAPPKSKAAESQLPLDIEELASRKFTRDSSVANRSSIAVLLEFAGQRLLVAGDAGDDALQDVYFRRGLGTPGTRLELDAMVVPHNGSRRNTSRKFLETIDCQRYLVSGNGQLFKHPDPETIARILLHGGPEPELFFNYRSKINAVWDDAELKAEHGYRTVYPPGDGIGLHVDLIAPQGTAATAATSCTLRTSSPMPAA